MNTDKQLLKKLEQAIDQMDTPKINHYLDELSKQSSPSIVPEDVALFSARIKKQKEETSPMKKTIKPMTVAIVAAIVVLMSITVYASGILNRFIHADGNTLTTLYTTDSMTASEAEEYMKNNDEEIDPSQVISIDPEKFEFETVQDAVSTMDMNVPLPIVVNNLTLDSATGHKLSFDNSTETRTLWLNYSDDTHDLGVTITREVVDPNNSVTGVTTHDIDPGSLGTYTTPAGVTYTTLSESNPHDPTQVAYIAVTAVGEYEYALVFTGYTPAEQESIINSVDLSDYR